MLYVALIGILIFFIYNIVLISQFDIPESLSDSFYLFNSKKKNLGYLFTGMMFAMALCLLPQWITVTETISAWSQYLTILPFVAAGSIMFVGAAPAFKGIKMESQVHTISAIVAASASLLWCLVVCYQLAYVFPIVLLLIAAIAHGTKTAGDCKTYWLEMVAFVTTFVTLIIESILKY